MKFKKISFQASYETNIRMQLDSDELKFNSVTKITFEIKKSKR